MYANWHGRQPPVVIGERNRMPLYAGYLALFYHRDLSDPAFFEVAKRANIYLSLALLVLLAVIFFRELPPLAATNLTGIAVARQGRRKIGDNLVERIDPRGVPYYWIGPMRDEAPNDAGRRAHRPVPRVR